jgi:hypothetical protein
MSTVFAVPRNYREGSPEWDSSMCSVAFFVK